MDSEQKRVSLNGRLTVSRYKNGLLAARGAIDPSSKLPVGHWDFFNSFGRPTESGSFETNGQRSGEWTHYDWDQGKVFAVTYQHGRKIGSRYRGTIAKILRIEHASPLSYLNRQLSESISTLPLLLSLVGEGRGVLLE